MNKNKQIDRIRKRNSDLSEQLRDLKFRLEYDTQLNSEGYRHAKELITDLEKIRAEWLTELKHLKKQQAEYDALLSDMRAAKSVLTDMGFQVPWYKKLFGKTEKKTKK